MFRELKSGRVKGTGSKETNVLPPKSFLGIIFLFQKVQVKWSLQNKNEKSLTPGVDNTYNLFPCLVPTPREVTYETFTFLKVVKDSLGKVDC